jgi:ligand-binding SRPBCC domain-containing protein
VRALGQLDAGGRPRVLVSASAIGWYGDRGDTPLREQSDPGEGFLAQVCRDWESAVFEAQALDVRTVAVRIGVVLGRDGGALEPLLPLFRLGLGGRVGSGRQWFSWIHLDDLVGLLRRVVEDPRAAGPVNGVAPEPVTNATFTAELGRVLRRPAVLPVPAMALRAALGEMSTVLLASQRVEPTAARQLGYAFQFPTLRSALEDLCADRNHELIIEQKLTHAPNAVFPFFSDPANLEKITPPFLRFRVLGATTPRIGDGTLINYALRLHGMPLRWQSRIESWKPSDMFVDVQTRGPYAFWHHTHEFHPADGGTVIRDRVRYRLPFGALGDLVAGWMVRRDLEAVFNYRRQRIQEIFE